MHPDSHRRYHAERHADAERAFGIVDDGLVPRRNRRRRRSLVQAWTVRLARRFGSGAATAGARK